MTLLALAIAATAAAQLPQPPPRPRASATESEARSVDLAQIGMMGENYQDQYVQTQGVLQLMRMNQYYMLTDGSARVLVLSRPVVEPELQRLAGRDVEVRGIVRRLRKKQYVNGVDLDLLEHPDLPVLPEVSAGLPPFSITVLAILETEGLTFTRRHGGATPVSAAALLADAGHGRVVVTGQFRGANLFGDLSASSRRTPGDWVLKDGDTALWVTGRPPRGKGWSLDPAYKADTARWLEVTGTPEVLGGVLYLRAVSIQLIPAPER